MPTGSAPKAKTINFALRQIGELVGQAFIRTICEVVFDCDIVAFGIANVSKATAD